MANSTFLKRYLERENGKKKSREGKRSAGGGKRVVFERDEGQTSLIMRKQQSGSPLFVTFMILPSSDII